jgi:hypothetical protein
MSFVQMVCDAAVWSRRAGGDVAKRRRRVALLRALLDHRGQLAAVLRARGTAAAGFSCPLRSSLRLDQDWTAADASRHLCDCLRVANGGRFRTAEATGGRRAGDGAGAGEV